MAVLLFTPDQQKRVRHVIGITALPILPQEPINRKETSLFYPLRYLLLFYPPKQ